MADNRLRLEGWQELGEALRNLPRTLVADGRAIVREAAQALEADLTSKYPVLTGKLRRGVETITINDDEHGAAYKVRSRAPHAWIVDHGTTRRATRRGFNRGTHRKPTQEVFIPGAKRQRAAMRARLAELVRAAGFTVTGT